ncbi:MAG: dihydrolipoyl dehydrogenase [Flexilinea sp.]|nr:dihydrolipoyl dehydrogenase [Flexilinea sp.]
MKEYDVIVLGAGPGGYTAALRTAGNGLKTAVVEKESLGGVCLNVGCIPSKSLLKNAEIARTLRKDCKTFGITCENLNLDYTAAVERSRKVSKRLNQGIAFLMKNAGVDVFFGKGEFADPHTVRVALNDGGEEELHAGSVIVACGTKPVEIPGMLPDGEKILNYRQAILQTTLPKRVVIIGGGAIGVEFATVWNSYGSAVTIVEMQSHLLPNEDAEAGAELERSFKKQGIKIKTGTALCGVDKTDDGVIVHLKQNDTETTVEADQVVIVVGFRSNAPDLGLNKAGVAMTARGWIEVDDMGRTSVPGIYAIGDIAGKVLLAHTAEAMGKMVGDLIAGKDPAPLRYDLMPHATYSHPQVASFGYTEESAKAAGVDYRVGKAGFIANGKALGLAENEGWVKLLCDAETKAIIGAVLVGPEVSELLPELSLAAAHGLTAEDIALNVHAHPTLSEVLMEAAEQVK